MRNILKIEGFLHDGDIREPFVARISAPKRSGRRQEYSCSIHAPALFKKDKLIFGVDAAQAQELAVQFLKSMLDGKHLTQKNGRRVDLGRRRPPCD
jgi:hypothetical protein